MTEEEYNSLRSWQHKYADRFFDLFVEYELKTMGERVMPEGEIYAIAYNNSIVAADSFHSKDPNKAAEITFKELIR